MFLFGYKYKECEIVDQIGALFDELTSFFHYYSALHLHLRDQKKHYNWSLILESDVDIRLTFESTTIKKSLKYLNKKIV